MGKIEALRAEMYICIDLYGINDDRTIDKSQELDKALNELSQK